ncbi:nuclear transport factor 2 family protein [Mycobacterium sp. MBM]|nr:nuclear transport factor 2 family protein [Mycobacterium sp. MBM]
MADMLAEDVVVDLDASNPASVPIVGRETVLAALKSAVEGARTVHQVHLPEISIDGEVAEIIWPVQERVIWSNGTSLTAFGHYHDTWRRERNQWLLAAMRLSHLMMDFDSQD